MKKDSQTPATKADLNELHSELQADIKQLETSFDAKLDSFKEEIVGHFHVLSGQLKHDVLGALKDGLSVMRDRDSEFDTRITRLERHAGLAATT